MIELEAIGLATLCRGSKKTEEGNVTDTWRGTIQTISGQKVAYVKMLPENQLISETVCALLGRALNLSIPKPYLVRVKREMLPDSREWKKDETERICFGSEDLKHPSLKRLINPINKRGKPVPVQPGLAKVFVDELLKWDGFQETAIFDEWVANRDRNPGNVLWDGKKFYLIDHSHALTGGNWKPSDLMPDKVVPNLLLNAVEPRLNPVERTQWKNKADLERFRYQSLPISTLQESGKMDLYDTEGVRNDAVEFVQKRTLQVLGLVCDRLKIGLLPI